MSLTSAITNALSGMRASTAGAKITGSNLANATNENYARRTLVVEANTIGDRGGVRIVGVQRQANPALAASWRDANSAAAFSRQRAEDAAAVQSLFGDPTNEGSLTNRLTQFEQSLQSAAARPDLTERLDAAAGALDALVGSINSIGEGLQSRREAADRQISALSYRMNEILDNLQDLNVRIVSARSQGQDPSGLLDQQEQLVDELSGITDIRVYQRERDAIAIYSQGGLVLLDANAAEVSFDPSATITADMTLTGGQLGGIQINGDPATVGATSGRLQGGQLGALFEFRDNAAVAHQAEIDAFAFELSARLNDPALDPTRGPGDPGFLTDAGAPVDPADIVGLSNRLELALSVDRERGGDPRRLRDGLLAATPGPVGNASLLNGLSSALSAGGVVANGAWSGETMSFDSLATSLTNRSAQDLDRAQKTQSFAMAQSESLRAYKLETGVDSDFELQNLMLLEQAYAANAQVLRTVDEMMDTLLRAF